MKAKEEILIDVLISNGITLSDEEKDLIRGLKTEAIEDRTAITLESLISLLHNIPRHQALEIISETLSSGISPKYLELFKEGVKDITEDKIS